MRILKIVQLSAVGDRADQSGEFQRSLLNLFPEAGEHAPPAVFRRRRREITGLFPGDIQTGLLPVAKFVSIMGHPVIPQFLTEGCEIEVIGTRDGLRQVHRIATGHSQDGGLLHKILFQSGQRDGQLDGGAGLKAGPEGKLLVDYGENAARIRIDHHYRTVVGAEGIDRRAANSQIFAFNVVARGGVGVGRLVPGLNPTVPAASRRQRPAVPATRCRGHADGTFYSGF